MMGGSNEEGAVVKDLERLDLNGHVSDGDVSEVVEMREGARVRYEEDAPVRLGAESAPALGHAESEALKRYLILISDFHLPVKWKRWQGFVSFAVKVLCKDFAFLYSF